MRIINKVAVCIAQMQRPGSSSFLEKNIIQKIHTWKFKEKSYRKPMSRMEKTYVQEGNNTMLLR